MTRLQPDDASKLTPSLESEGIETLALPSRETTTYVNDYSGAEDTHELRSRSDPILPDDVPEAWRTADLIQLGPLHYGDIHPETAGALTGFKGLDLQGLIREQRLHLDPEARLRAFLEPGRTVDVVHGNEQELEELLAGRSEEKLARDLGIGELLVTRGARGALIVTRDGAHEVPAVSCSGTSSIGAGDVFLGAYLLFRVRGMNPRDAAHGAARVSAAKISHGQVPKGFDPEGPTT